MNRGFPCNGRREIRQTTKNIWNLWKPFLLYHKADYRFALKVPKGTMLDPAREALPDMRKIKAKKIAADIRARMSDFELMSKYELSLEQVEEVLEKLVEAGTIREAEIKERSLFFDDPANRLKTRRFPENIPQGTS